MKRAISLLLCLLTACACLASCDALLGGGEAHTHTYDEKNWESDAQGHWHNPTCECEDAGIKKLGHADENNDAMCDVCKFTNHTHEYETESWTADCTNHWRAPVCGHIVAGADTAPHADTNEDGRCDDCNYVIEEIHDHLYSPEWTGDEAYHWHAAICEHGVEIADKEAHSIDAAGYCTVCDAKINEIDKTDILAVLQAAIARNHKVISGNVIANESVFGGTIANPVLENAMTSNVYFVLGNGSSYIVDKTIDANGVILDMDSYWYQQLGENEYFGVAVEGDSNELKRVTGGPDKFNGYTYLPGGLLSASDNTETLAQTLYEMYLLMGGESVENAEESYDPESGKYNFSYKYTEISKTDQHSASGEYEVVYQVYVYGVAAEFSVDENGVIQLATFSVSSFRNFEYDMDLTYDPETGVITYTDNANPTVYTYNVYQTSGTRTYTTPYPKASLVPMDFELYDTDAYWDNSNPSKLVVTRMDLIEETVTIPQNVYARFYLGNPIPMSSSFAFIDTEDFSIEIVNNDPNSTTLMCDPEYIYYSTFEGFIGFYPRNAGSYTVSISFGEVTKVITVIVEDPDAPVLGEDDENTVNVLVTDNYGWFDDYSYTAGKTGTYTFTIPAGLGMYSFEAHASQSAPEADYYRDGGAEQHVIYLTEGETFEFYVASVTKGAYVITVEYADGGTPGTGRPAAPSKELIIGGNNQIGGEISLSYTADEAGTLTLELSTVIGGEVTLSYTVNGGESTPLDLSAAAEITLAAGDELVISVVATGNATMSTEWTAAE